MVTLEPSSYVAPSLGVRRSICGGIRSTTSYVIVFVAVRPSASTARTVNVWAPAVETSTGAKSGTSPSQETIQDTAEEHW